MQSFITFLQARKMQSVASSLRSLRSGFSKRWPGLIYDVQSTFQIAVSAMQKHSKRYVVWYRWMSVFMFIVILDQMILRSFSIPLDFWYPRACVATFCWTISQWLLARSGERRVGKE